MKIEMSIIFEKDLDPNLATRIALHLSSPANMRVDSRATHTVVAGKEADFDIELEHNPYLVLLLKADKLNVSRVLEDVASQMNRGLENAGLRVKTIHAQMEPKGTNAHSDTVRLTF